MVINGVHFPEDRITDFCARHGVSRLSVFGSILRDDFGPGSDVDMLVEFHPGRTPGMIGFGQMILDVSEIIGRKVDLRTPFVPRTSARLSPARHGMLHAA
jgi:predicted nucleotidyltransferase